MPERRDLVTIDQRQLKGSHLDHHDVNSCISMPKQRGRLRAAGTPRHCSKVAILQTGSQQTTHPDLQPAAALLHTLNIQNNTAKPLTPSTGQSSCLGCIRRPSTSLLNHCSHGAIYSRMPAKVYLHKLAPPISAVDCCCSDHLRRRSAPAAVQTSQCGWDSTNARGLQQLNACIEGSQYLQSIGKSRSPREARHPSQAC